jgi:hypothetical protein
MIAAGRACRPMAEPTVTVLVCTTESCQTAFLGWLA